MDIIAVTALALAPGVFWLWFFYKRDRLEPEPKSLMIKMFLLGMLLVLPAVIIEHPFGVNKFLLLVICAPLAEELLKFFALRLTIYNNRAFRNPMDGIMFAAAVALGFATAENTYFILAAYLAPQIALGVSDPVWAFGMVWKLYLLRAFLTVPGHALWSAIWGYALGIEKADSGGKIIVVKSLALSLALHSLFNLMLLNFPPGAVGMLILVPSMWFMVHKRMIKAGGNLYKDFSRH
jgi:RsiW-degrading membrane proteinase PrsW (M82 family)